MFVDVDGVGYVGCWGGLLHYSRVIGNNGWSVIRQRVSSDTCHIKTRITLLLHGAYITHIYRTYQFVENGDRIANLIISFVIFQIPTFAHFRSFQ